MEWFKFRMCWCGPLLKMNDEEIGRLIRALLTFARTEEEQEISGRGEIFLYEITEILREDLRQFRENAEKKRQSARNASLARWKTKHPEADHEDAEACGPHQEENQECKNKKQNKNSETEKEEDTEAESETEWGSSSGLPPAATELPVITIPLVNGTEHPVFRKDIDEYAGLYQDVNIDRELRNMRGWCLANPTRRKTKRGVKAFINSWLKKAQQEADRKPDAPENPFLAYARGEKEIGDYLL